MSVAFYRGQQLGRDDLNLFLDNANGNPVNAAEIYYALYDFTTGKEVLLGHPKRIPANPSIGEYYASVIIPLDANIGSYRVRWFLKQTIGAPLESVVQEFEVIDKATTSPTSFLGMTATEADLVRRLRILLRDSNPDKNYKFRPPAHAETVRQFNRVFGHIWEDDELNEFIQRSMDMVVAAPPRTPFASVDAMVRERREWTTLLLIGAQMFAVDALRLNWVSEEFSLAPDTMVDVILPDGREVSLPIVDLYNIIYGDG